MTQLIDEPYKGYFIRHGRLGEDFVGTKYKDWFFCARSLEDAKTHIDAVVTAIAAAKTT